ncbi:tumor necrosis factor ligand superfamily member 9 [Loxodonta africana]|uniref:tumor necrosis factor ligand superfamily member 9 n=1 Tax=Loxodonta africana TaxID=9785 RepID=UPI0002236708|nr:tumor necrosis factor ligand superfamily member 9 [Loxodonta africana]XP_049737306.1 tumor necrosis factor ligand superfamily member 9 [Elephas maximus indicus]
MERPKEEKVSERKLELSKSDTVRKGRAGKELPAPHPHPRAGQKGCRATGRSRWGCPRPGKPRGKSATAINSRAQVPDLSRQPLAMRPLVEATPDPEAQLPASRVSACRRLDWVLGASLLLLAAACVTCAARFWLVPAAPGPVPSPSPHAGPEPQPGARFRCPDCPQDGFAQLVASSAQLTNGTLSWHSDSGLAGVFLAPGLSYDALSRELVVAEGGIYYVFLRLELQRVVAGEGSGWVSMALHLQPDRAALTLTVALPTASLDSAGGSRGHLLRLSVGQRLAVHLRASAAAHPAWQLTQGATVLGLFRVAPEAPVRLGLPSPQPA